MNCACPSADAAACYTMRNGGQDFYVVGGGIRDDFTGKEERCSCSCHQDDDEDDSDWRYDHFDFKSGGETDDQDVPASDGDRTKSDSQG